MTILLKPLRDITATRPSPGAIVVPSVYGHHQLTPSSCGPAAVYTVAHAITGKTTLGDWRSIKNRTQCCLHRGTPSYRLISALEDYAEVSEHEGIDYETVSKALLNGNILVTTLRMPGQDWDETHWVVLAGVTEDAVLALNCTRRPFDTKRWIRWQDMYEDDGEEVFVVHTELPVTSPSKPVVERR